jgi:hypothetical protein
MTVMKQHSTIGFNLNSSFFIFKNQYHVKNIEPQNNYHFINYFSKSLLVVIKLKYIKHPVFFAQKSVL